MLLKVSKLFIDPIVVWRKTERSWCKGYYDWRRVWGKWDCFLFNHSEFPDRMNPFKGLLGLFVPSNGRKVILTWYKWWRYRNGFLIHYDTVAIDTKCDLFTWDRDLKYTDVYRLHFRRCKYLPTAGEGNVFRSVCLSTGGGGGAVGRPPRQRPPQQKTPPDREPPLG